VGVEPTESSL